MPSDLIANLRALARSEHMDLSLGDDAADEIERLRAESADLYAVTHSALPANMLEAADPEHPVPGMAALGRAQQRYRKREADDSPVLLLPPETPIPEGFRVGVSTIAMCGGRGPAYCRKGSNCRQHNACVYGALSDRKED